MAASNLPTVATTISGRHIDLADPSPADIDIVDIAYSLAGQARNNGHTRGALWSVADHSLLVSGLVWVETGNHRLALAGLLHDAAEAYTGDIISPMGRAIAPMPPTDRALAWREACLDAAIREALGGDYNTPFDREVTHADEMALRIEWECFMPTGVEMYPAVAAIKRAADDFRFLDPFERVLREKRKREATGAYYRDQVAGEFLLEYHRLVGLIEAAKGMVG